MLATPPSSADASPDEKTAIKSHLNYTQSLTEIPHQQRLVNIDFPHRRRVRVS